MLWLWADDTCNDEKFLRNLYALYDIFVRTSSYNDIRWPHVFPSLFIVKLITNSIPFPI